ncbi:Protein kinase domain-containing protein [Entamoeba marina]
MLPKYYIPYYGDSNENLQNVFYNIHDHCYYYISIMSSFNHNRYQQIDNVTTQFHHTYIIATSSNSTIIRYSLPQSPIRLKEYFNSNSINGKELSLIFKQLGEFLFQLHSKITALSFSNDSIQDSIIPSISHAPIVGKYQQDIYNILYVILSPIYLDNTSYVMQHYLEDESLRLPLKKCSPFLEKMVMLFLTSPTPSESIFNYYEVSLNDLKYMLNHSPELLIPPYFKIKYVTSEHTQKQCIYNISIPLTFQPIIPQHIHKETFFSNKGHIYTFPNKKYTIPSYYVENEQLYFVFPRKQIRSTIFAKLAFLHLQPSNQITHFNYNYINLSLFLNEEIETFNCKSLKISLTPFSKEYTTYDFPQTPLQQNCSLLLWISSKLRSKGFIVKCRTSIHTLKFEELQSTTVIIVSNIWKVVRGFVMNINEMNHEEQRNHFLNILMNNIEQLNRETTNNVFQTFNNYKELISLIQTQQQPKQQMRTNKWCSLICSFAKGCSIKRKSNPTKPFISFPNELKNTLPVTQHHKPIQTITENEII